MFTINRVWILTLFSFFSAYGMEQPFLVTTPLDALLKPYVIAETCTPYILKQVKTLDQMRTHESTAGSCGYHALRNGLLLLAALEYPEQAGHFLALLLSPEDMRQKLRTAGTWRTEIRKSRNDPRDDADWLDDHEIKCLVKKEAKENPLLKLFDVHFYGAGGHAEPNPLLAQAEQEKVYVDYESSQVLDDIKTIYNDIHAGKRFSALIIIRLAPDPSYAADVLAGLKSIACKLTNTEPSLDSINAAKRNECNAHWIALVVHSLGTHREYIVADSLPHIRIKDRTVNEIIDLLEGTQAKSENNQAHVVNNIRAEELSELAQVEEVNPQNIQAEQSLQQASAALAINRYRESITRRNERLWNFGIFSAAFATDIGLYCGYRYYQNKKKAVQQYQASTPQANFGTQL